MRLLWRRLVTFGFRLLYNELAWLYDAVSWLASMGLWRRWQRTALAFLPSPGARVLELGFGPGHLLIDLACKGYRVAGLDQSPAMVRLAGRRLHRLGRVQPSALDVLLCRGRAGALPFASGSFDAVVATFPTAYVADPAFLRGLARVLRPGGRLVVAEEAVFGKTGIVARALEWLYGVTGQRGPGAPGLGALLEAAGLRAWRETVPVDGTAVRLIVAEIPGE
ncbi:MAG TPA: methyltransferase domain-containing protein [Anaerolineae bacterium]|nr:methyltransferase domain-containing protein [Anaerolineae bacterium]